MCRYTFENAQLNLNIEKKDTIFSSAMYHQSSYYMDGWMDVHFGSWALTLSKDCSLASFLPPCHNDIASGRVIPAKNPIHSCKYSTGVNLTVLVCQWCNCYCQLRKAPPTTVFSLYNMYLGKNTYKLPKYMNLKKSSYRPNSHL